MMSDTCGLTFYAPLGKWDHDSRSWKTSEATSLWALTLSSLTLPTWGGLHDGELFELPTPELATNALDCSSLPTPRATDGTKGGPNQRGSSGDQMLPSAVMGFLPTPAVNDMGEGKTLEWWDDWAPRQKSSDGRPAPHGKSLAIEAMRMLPTPNTMDSMDARSDEALSRAQQSGGCFNLKDVIPRIGATTPLSSPDGNTSSDDPHQHQLSLDGLAHPA